MLHLVCQVTYRAWTSVLAFQMSTVNSMGAYREECHVQSQVSGRHASLSTVTVNSTGGLTAVQC